MDILNNDQNQNQFQNQNFFETEKEMEEFENCKNSFTEFLNDEYNNEYLDKITTLIKTNKKRLLIDLEDIRKFDAKLLLRLLRKPILIIKAMEEALQDIIDIQSNIHENINDKILLKDKLHEKYHLGFIGPFGSHLLSPRGLLASYLTKLVCIEAIVTKISVVRPKLVKSVHYCKKTGQSHSRAYRDSTSIEGLPTTLVLPQTDNDNNPLEIEFGLSTYQDSQKITIQEMPERAPLGQLPRSIDVVLSDDLVDMVKPGDRVRIAGIYRALAGFGAAKSTTGIFQTCIIASSVQIIGKEVGGIVMTPDDIQNIKQIAKNNNENVFKKIAKSLAPSIYGHKFIKRALLLMLLGGVEKNLENGTHLRGDINILMVGDPSTAKSQLLRFVLGIAPLAVSTTGRGSSGVGLTAAGKKKIY